MRETVDRVRERCAFILRTRTFLNSCFSLLFFSLVTKVIKTSKFLKGNRVYCKNGSKISTVQYNGKGVEKNAHRAPCAPDHQHQTWREPKMLTRSKVLEEANALIHGDRQNHYGPPSENFAAIAQMWSAYLGHNVEPRDVCNMMALLKIARLRNGQHDDSTIDCCGYIALGAEVS